MKDEMQAFSGIAQSYSEMPLSILHQLQSVLTIEINNRLESFGEYSLGKSGANSGDNVMGSVAEVEAKQTVFSSGNLQEKSDKKAHLTLVRN